MSWCELNDVDYVLGLAKNERLKKEIIDQMQQAKELYEQSSQAARVYKDFEYRTLESWSKARRVVGKAEYLPKGENPRFVVTSLCRDEFDAGTLYEQQYCARGEMENRIKEQQLFLFSTRAVTRSTWSMTGVAALLMSLCSMCRDLRLPPWQPCCSKVRC